MTQKYLPCIKCGSSLSIVEGSLIQCFFCGTKSVYSDSIILMNTYLMEILNIASVDKFPEKLTNHEIEAYKSSISSYFHNLSSKFYNIRYLIITKIDEVELNREEVLELVKKAGVFKIIIEDLLLPHIQEGLSKKDFQEMRDFAYFMNKSLLGLYFSILAKEKFQYEECSKFYQFAERNYQNIVEYCINLKIESPKFSINKNKLLYEILAKFAALLRNILNENPTYSSEKFEALLRSLDNLEEKNFQIFELQSQIERIYTLGRDTSLLLEELRLADPLNLIDPLQENLLYNSAEVLENIDRIRNWIDEISIKYQDFQKKLLKLHSGTFINYLEAYRTEFTNRKNADIVKYDDLIYKIINKALGDYNLETIETLDILNDFIKKLDLSNETVIQRFEIEHDDLIKIDEMLKNFILELFKKPINRNFENEFSRELIELISGKHSEFDTYILKFSNKLLHNFEDYRNEKALSMDEQKNLFNLDLKLKIQRLINASFTLQEDLIPYPLFIEVILLSKTLTVGIPEKISVIIENPSLNIIKNVSISFFTPNSFQSKLRFYQIKKIKAKERHKVDTEIVPMEKGTYHFMVMVEYQSVGETFWMPSIRHDLEVNEEI
ncbi:MAG: hypothetical protein ACTSR8_05505 [Promethearchaeota archaeon]